MADLRITPAAIAPITPPRLEGPARADGAGGFVEALGRALGEVNAQQLASDDTAAAVAAGKPVDMSAAVVTMEKANITFQFALQIRNKLLEAYQDVMRLSV
jgi:flagellar hook-basal body complex protein FliE